MNMWKSIGEFFRQLREGSKGGFMLVELDEDEPVERIHCVRCGAPLRITIPQGEGELWTKCSKCTRDEHSMKLICMFFRVKRS